MSGTDTTLDTPGTSQEEWFLARLDEPQIAAGPLLKFLAELGASGHAPQAAAWADLLLETLIEKSALRDAIGVLALRAEWQEGDKSFRAVFPEQLRRVFSAAPDKKALIDQIGLDKGLPIKECVRRLLLLLDLRPGGLCYEKTWGFGLVKQVDLFYKRVEIDFARKTGHQLSLAYAAETLELLAETHILAMFHRDPAQVKEMIQNRPGEVVRLCLRSYGPLSVNQLQEKLAVNLVPESDWKRFWEGARKDLKKDALVHVPGNRNEPIRLLDKPIGFDADWFARQSRERDMETVLDELEALTEEKSASDLSAAELAILADRLKFVLIGADRKQLGWVGRAVMLAVRWGLAGDRLDVSAQVEAAFSEAGLTGTVRKLPARLIRPFLLFLIERDEARALALYLQLLPGLEISALNEVMDILIERGREPACAERFKKLLDKQEAGVEILNWIVRHLDKVNSWSLGSLENLAGQTLTSLEQNYSGERLKAKNQLRERFERDEWLEPVLDSMAPDRRSKFFLRLKDSSAFPVIDHRSILARVIKRHPELERLMTGKNADTVESSGSARGSLTSQRSFKERQAQLEKITQVDIPANSKEIGLARSYGDLRENFEFKAAKDMQRLLLRRQAELQDMLLTVRPTDFRGLSTGQVGLGTGVTLRYADGRAERYFILGEWDRDEKLNIISSTTRMAGALMGHRKNEEVVVPTETGEERCTIQDIAALSDEVQAWVDGS